MTSSRPANTDKPLPHPMLLMFKGTQASGNTHFGQGRRPPRRRGNGVRGPREGSPLVAGVGVLAPEGPAPLLHPAEDQGGPQKGWTRTYFRTSVSSTSNAQLDMMQRSFPWPCCPGLRAQGAPPPHLCTRRWRSSTASTARRWRCAAAAATCCATCSGDASGGGGCGGRNSPMRVASGTSVSQCANSSLRGGGQGTARVHGEAVDACMPHPRACRLTHGDVIRSGRVRVGVRRKRPLAWQGRRCTSTWCNVVARKGL